MGNIWRFAEYVDAQGGLQSRTRDRYEYYG
ncbi:MAG: hypothetical protein CM1200mP36_10870 [Gammaproteobacteria bacterium]|nr:MAG: hypothetical protein CM1200mP36_10870 [Gammaproteobacteria bacterium]